MLIAQVVFKISPNTKKHLSSTNAKLEWPGHMSTQDKICHYYQVYGIARAPKDCTEGKACSKVLSKGKLVNKRDKPYLWRLNLWLPEHMSGTCSDITKIIIM